MKEKDGHQDNGLFKRNESAPDGCTDTIGRIIGADIPADIRARTQHDQNDRFDDFPLNIFRYGYFVRQARVAFLKNALTPSPKLRTIMFANTISMHMAAAGA